MPIPGAVVCEEISVEVNCEPVDDIVDWDCAVLDDEVVSAVHEFDVPVDDTVDWGWNVPAEVVDSNVDVLGDPVG